MQPIIYFAFLLNACSSSENTEITKADEPNSETEINLGTIDVPNLQLMTDGRYPDLHERIVIVSNDILFPEDNFETLFQFSSMPALDGRWEWLSDSRLAYYPKNLKPDTSYKIKAIVDGTEYVTELTTGAFSLLSSTVFRTGTDVKVSITTTAAVGCDDALGAIKLETASQRIAPTECEASQYPNTFRLSFPVANSIKKVHLTGRLNALENGDTLSLSQFEELNDAKPVTIVHADAQETGEGHSIRVLCNDESVDDESWFWDSDIDFDDRISDYCHVSPEELMDNVSVNPTPGGLDFLITQHGFHILGDFTKGEYTLTINAGMATVNGGALNEDYHQSIEVDSHSPSVAFTGSGRYLPRASWDSVPFRYRNTDALELVISRVPVENINTWSSKYYESVKSSDGDVVHVSQIATQPKDDKFHTEWLKLSEHLNQLENGVYELMISDQQVNAVTAMRVVVSDIQLVAKRDTVEDGRLHLWAIDTNTLQPLEQVRLSVHRPSGTEDSFCLSNGQGYCSLAAAPKDDLGNSRQHMVVAQTSSDYSFMLLSEVAVQTNSFNVGGISYGKANSTVAIHSDRGAYRPGDQVYLFALARNEQHLALQDTSLKLNVYDSQANPVFQEILTTNAAGAIETVLSLPDFSATGEWSVQLLSADDSNTLRGSYTFYVEDLMPERMALEITPQVRELLRGEKLTIDISAQYLFGALASKDDFELTCTVSPRPFRPVQHANYNYPTGEFNSYILGSVRGQLDEFGRATVQCPSMERLSALDSTAKLELQLSVFEGGSGRASRKRSAVTVHPSKHYVGIKSSRSNVVSGQSLVFNGVVVNWKGERISSDIEGEAVFSSLETGYAWTFDPSTGNNRYERRQLPLSSQSDRISINNGAFLYTVVPTGEVDTFELTVKAEGAQGRMTLGRNYWSFEEKPTPSRPDTLAISVPKAVSIGKPFTAKVEVPYSGRLLWSIESDGVLLSEWTEVSEIGEQEWTTSIPEMPFAENVYVSALLLKDPHSESLEDFIPARSFGTTPLKISPDDFAHSLSLTVPEETSPNDPLSVSIDLGGSVPEGTIVFVQAVDEGLLSLTNFASPNPFLNTFLFRALGVSTHETIGWTQMSIGGTQAMGGGASGNGERPDVVKPVTLWSGMTQVPASGKVSVQFDLPRYNGQLRIMAVSSGPDRLGHASATVRVKEPIVVQTTLPRFLIRGDTVQIPVRMTNTTDSKQDVEMTIEVSDPGALTILSASDGLVPLEPGEAKTVAFQAKVQAESGTATVRIGAKSKVYSAIDEQIVPFSSNRPRERRTTRIDLMRGSNSLTSVMEGWVADETNIWVTTNPYGQALAHASHLIRYPYGCVEQTSSSLRPLIASRGLYKLVDPNQAKDANIDEMIAHGIKRLASMQTNEGGMGYWPGAYRAHPWGTAYATHVLLDAQAAQHNVPSHVLDNALNYLQSYLNNDDPYYRNARAYAHYLLARTGRGNSAAIRAELSKKYHPEDRFLLQAALYHSGDRTYDQVLKGLSGVTEVSNINQHYYFGSQLRSKGLMLSIHQSLFGHSEPAGEALASVIANQLSKKSRYYNTQELAWSVFALAKRTEGLGQGVGKSQLLVSGQNRALTIDNGENGRSWGVWNASEHTLELQLPNLDGKAYAFVTTEGARLDATYEYGGSGLRVFREFINHEGKPVDLNSQKLGDLVYVRTTIKNTSGRNLTELALVDRLPASWEIENANLGGSDNAKMLATKELWASEHQNIRDSRLEVFGDLDSGQTVQIVYAARASLGGNYQLPPVEVEAMYDPSIWARAKGGSILVDSPWAGNFL